MSKDDKNTMFIIATFATGVFIGSATMITAVFLNDSTAPQEFADNYCQTKGFDKASAWNFEKDAWWVNCEKEACSGTKEWHFVEEAKQWDA